MNTPWILSSAEFYRRMDAYVQEYGLPYAETGWRESVANEAARLRPILGEGQGRAALDASCGWGRQALALAGLGWQVSGADVCESSLTIARTRAAELGLELGLRTCDVRAIGREFAPQFDLSLSCYALYEIADGDELQMALNGLRAVLRPGGKCYIQLRDMDFLAEEQPRNQFHGERRGPGWRMFCVEDWDFIDDEHVIHQFAFLREDEVRPPQDHFRWTSETIGVRKRILRKEELVTRLRAAGFQIVTCLPRPAPWFPVEYVCEG